MLFDKVNFQNQKNSGQLLHVVHILDVLHTLSDNFSVSFKKCNKQIQSRSMHKGPYLGPIFIGLRWYYL